MTVERFSKRAEPVRRARQDPARRSGRFQLADLRPLPAKQYIYSGLEHVMPLASDGLESPMTGSVRRCHSTP
jgi:hypothetical protein